jgi:D-arabinose 1-dehydrogenase-like Zn-dependent alcohol dehydrogenase
VRRQRVREDQLRTTARSPCDACRRGDTFACQTATRITGITADGGYADYMIAHASALARVPDALSDVEAAPLMCAGITTFNALRNSAARSIRQRRDRSNRLVR